LPPVFIRVAASGFAPQSGEDSLATVSPVAAVVMLVIGPTSGMAMRSEPRP
jgi:hypothetical protein